MEQSTLIIRYYDERMLLTLDLTTLIGILLREFHAPLELHFEPMSAEERDQVSEMVDGIRAVRERFWLFHTAGDTLSRLQDLERRVVKQGQK